MEKQKSNTHKETLFGFDIQRPISVDQLSRLDTNEAIEREKLATLFNKIENDRESGVINKEDLNIFYSKLSNFIESDTNNDRLVLYLPFAVLPDIKTERHPEALRLAEVVKNSWFRLLYESEVRAVYVDGDELEPGLGTPPRVRKAAHLTPELMKLGILTENFLLDVFDANNDTELDQSLIEGFVVAQDLKLFSSKAWNKILAIADEKDLKIPVFIETGQTNEEANDAEAIIRIHSYKIKAIKDFYKAENKISAKRVKWEMGVRIDQVSDETSEKLALLLLKNQTTLDAPDSIGLCIRTLFKAVKIGRSARILEDNYATINKKWISGSTKEKDDIKTGLNHIVRLGIKTDLPEKLGIKILDLRNPLPIDVAKFLDKDGSVLIEALEKIKNSSELSKYVYPILLIFGSRIRGYSNIDGDFDMAIFIKPEASFEDRAKIETILNENVPEIKDIDRILEYWVSEKDGKLSLKVPPTDSPDTVVGPAQIHFIWSGVWVGEGNIIGKLKNDLYEKYTNLSRFGEQKELMRTKLLRQIELSVLQYRLLHKGYRKLYPETKTKGTKNAKLIDWESDFWDEGFRKVATNLFLKSVFLPDKTKH